MKIPNKKVKNGNKLAPKSIGFAKKKDARNRMANKFMNGIVFFVSMLPMILDLAIGIRGSAVASYFSAVFSLLIDLLRSFRTG